MTEAIRQGDIPGVQLRRRRHFAGVSAASLWSWLIETGKAQRWLASGVEIEPGRAGGLELLPGEDAEREIAETVDYEPPRRWVLAFRRAGWTTATRLELEIAEDAAGAELSVLQQGFEHLPLSEGLTLWEAYRRRWTEALDRLERALK